MIAILYIVIVGAIDIMMIINIMHIRKVYIDIFTLPLEFGSQLDDFSDDFDGELFYFFVCIKNRLECRVQ